MSQPPVLTSLDPRGVATVTLNRPQLNNAYDGDLIQGLLAAMHQLAEKSALRVVVLKGNGRHFQAGADLKWIDQVRTQSLEANEAASRATAEAVDRLNRLPVPVVALVQGACFGGGTGVVAACDIVIAADNAVFSITEVRWGLTAAIIIPQLNDAMSARQVRRYALTGERFGADAARRLGLVHEVVTARHPRSNGRPHRRPTPGERPEGHRRDQGDNSRECMGRLCARYARTPGEGSCRQAPDGGSGEGLASFAEKRSARWRPG